MGNIATDQLLKFIYLGANKTPDNITNKSDSDIIFYSDKHQIIVNDIVFGVTDEQAQAITAATSGIAALNQRVEMTTQLSVTILDILRNTRSKLDGATLGESGFQGAQSINDINGVQAANAVDAINALNTFIAGVQSQLNNTHAGVSKVNDVAPDTNGNVQITGAQVETTAAAGSMFGQQSIDTAFKGVQSNIDGIQSKLDTEISTRGTAISGVQTQIGNEKTAREAAITGVQGQFDTKIGIDGSQSVKDYVDNKAAAALAGAQANAEQTAKAYVDELAGTNWTEAAGTVKDIIDELQQSGAQGLDTLVDKIRDDFRYGTEGAQSTSVKGYIDGVVANANSSAQGAAEDAEQNAKDYADTQITAGIQALDSTKDNKDTHVYVQVEQEDGKLKGVQVNSIDIASASALSATQTELGGAQGRITNVENQLKWTVV